METQQEYWQECMAIAAEECELELTPEQLAAIASAAKSGHEHYGMAFYSPPCSERIGDIERDAADKLKRLQAEFDAFRNDAETAVKQALNIYSDTQVTIGTHGEVLMHAGETKRVQ